MTIELVDTSIVRELARKSDALTRFGKTDTPAKNSGFGFQSEPLLIAAAQADETVIPAANPQWIQTKGPGGVSNAGLFLTSDQTLYAIVKTGLYRLAETAEAWTFVSAGGPNREFSPVMAERDGTLYLLTPDEILVSIDDGKTLHSLDARPEGRAVALLMTDTAMYPRPRYRSVPLSGCRQAVGVDTEGFTNCSTRGWCSRFLHLGRARY